MKIDPYYWRQKCSAETNSLDMGHQMRVVTSKIAIFASCVAIRLEIPHMRPKLLSCEKSLNYFLSTLKQMILNDLE